eukprot:CAMPEP_0183485260 /NCGR_PEP_ID=MMETSP0370-20130417/179338_1 /TAXON_ID=268820 /ORGANISM="Peridinium aciculiferum, Strain PAER-2" /LENGTH=298 /DNA_ID=CAMNT_0025678561 /DNA_START=62 /DNA_END=959 /DNA_ORIENTATION=-
MALSLKFLSRSAGVQQMVAASPKILSAVPATPRTPMTPAKTPFGSMVSCSSPFFVETQPFFGEVDATLGMGSFFNNIASTPWGSVAKAKAVASQASAPMAPNVLAATLAAEEKRRQTRALVAEAMPSAEGALAYFLARRATRAGDGDEARVVAEVAADSRPPSLLGRRSAGLSGAAESASVHGATGVGLFGRRAGCRLQVAQPPRKEERRAVGAAESASVPAATGVGLFGRRPAPLTSDKTEVDNRRLPVMLGRRVSADATSAAADSVTAQLGAAGGRQAFLERRMRISERARACAVP